MDSLNNYINYYGLTGDAKRFEMNFPSKPILAQHQTKNAEMYAAAHLSRGTDPHQIGKFLEVCGLDPDPSIAFCAAGGCYCGLLSLAELRSVPFTDSSVVKVLRSLVETWNDNMAYDISASCEQVRQSAIKKGTWVSVDNMPDDLVFQRGWVALMNYETAGPEAHHFALITGDMEGDFFPTVEFNTTGTMPGGNQGRGGAVATKIRRFDEHFRGIIKAY